MNEQLRMGLFGYSKKSVHTYLSQLNEEFTQKLMEKELSHQEQLRELQAELERLTEENQGYLAQRQEVAEALIDAKLQGAALLEQAKQEDAVRRERNAARRQEENRRLSVLSGRIDRLQETLRQLMGAMDEELETHRLSCKTLESETEWAQEDTEWENEAE